MTTPFLRFRFLAALLTLISVMRVPHTASAENILLNIRDVPDHGLVVNHVDLTDAARWCQLNDITTKTVRATDESGRKVPCQFVPDADADGKQHVAGTIILQLASDYRGQIQLAFDQQSRAQPADPPLDIIVRTKHHEVVHSVERMGGFPSQITFLESGKVFKTLRWHDRVHHAQQGGFRLIDDRQARLQRISSGPLCTVVRVSGRYVRGADQPASQPSAVYHWFYFHDLPFVYVTAQQNQQQPFAWKEWHFLELIYPDDAFTRWAGSAPASRGDVAGTGNSIGFSDWAALLDGRNAIGMLRAGQMLIHDGRGAYGTYLHAFGNLAWSGFAGTQRELAAWMWIGCDDQPLSAIRTAADALPTNAQMTISVESVQRRLADIENEIAETDVDTTRDDWWQLAAAQQLQAQGRYAEALSAAEGRLPKEWTSLTAGDLAILFEHNGGGLRLLQLADLTRRQQLLSAHPLPLFQTVVRNAETRETVTLVADTGWTQATTTRDRNDELVLKWTSPIDQRLTELTVTITAQADAESHRITWDMQVENVPSPWAVWRTTFPWVALTKPGLDAEVFFPRGAGEVKSDVWNKAFRLTGTYPSGWMSMPFMAVYDRTIDTGLYTAVHDPWGSTKDLLVESRPEDRVVELSFDVPATNMGQPGTGFAFEGQAVWQLLRGDWYDAAVIYRDWVRQQAHWYPKLNSQGRRDTPPWMRKLSCWALTGGTAEQVVPATKEFQQALGVPIGVHWYSWHEIPFDNDYPHYFPTKPGFAEGVAELQANNVFVMPYINGRLWDTRDRGMEVFQFDQVARPAATKNEAGEPYTEMYGSKETDGSRVSLAAMCPTTDLWQTKVREIVLRLMNECGVAAVYIDQVAAAKPQLCFDASHGHPLGGGHWWTEGYWELLNRIHAQMPEDRMLTTECNAEPYTHCFDGYLTWHWQYDDQVPAFPAVYGGAIQMFGRAYRGGPTKDLALRMKAGQQLVYGEQIGWLNPSVTKEPDNLEFLRQVVQLRTQLIDYFTRGEMARPPRLEFDGISPTVTADWQWSGVWPVTTAAVLTGAWRLPNENRVVLIFANVSDETVSAAYDIDITTFGLRDGDITVRKITPNNAEEPQGESSRFRKELQFPPKSVWAFEITEKD